MNDLYQTILITGATSGFGKETAKIFIKNGWKVIITGRRDTQVRFQETVDMVNELKKYNKDYKYIIKGEEGHGFRRETARLELFQDYEEFLTEHLN